MSGSGSTPTKPVAPRRGRKPKEPSASDNCRMCGCCFKTQFGSFTGKSGWISSENMFVAPTRKGTIFSVSPQSHSPFSASFQTFCLTARAYLNTQKYGLFCSLIEE